MRRLSDDEKRVFSDQISLLKNENERLTDLNEEWRDRYKRKRAENIKTIARMDDDIDEYRNLYHLGCAKILSREAIIEQLSETELAQDNARLQEENTLLAEHNQALQKELRKERRKLLKEMYSNDKISLVQLRHALAELDEMSEEQEDD